MSETRTCDYCDSQQYASEPGAAYQRTVEYEADDGTIYSKDWQLCGRCHSTLIEGGGIPCPFCLEPLLQDESPADCPQRSGN
jgi:hypothetical protein